MKNLEILFEDDDILAVNKPAGLVVHSDGRTEEKTLVDWFEVKYPNSVNIGEPIKLTNGKILERHGIVHRIDRDTSGVILLVKTETGFNCLKKQFQDREVSKIYDAFVWTRFKEADLEGTINRPIGRNKKDFRQWSAQRGARGQLREAITDYKVISQLNDHSFVEVSPRTGRTHQIRVHFKAINHPVVCDALYAPKRPPALGFERTALHARSIVFSKTDGQKAEVKAPYPVDFEEAIKIFGIDS